MDAITDRGAAVRLLVPVTVGVAAAAVLALPLGVLAVPVGVAVAVGLVYVSNRARGSRPGIGTAVIVAYAVLVGALIVLAVLGAGLEAGFD